VLVVVAVGLGITQTAWGQERIRELAVRAIHDELGLDATFDEVEVEITALPPGIDIVARGIDLEHPEHGAFIRADMLRIHPSLTAFLGGNVDLERIELDGPSVHLLVRDGEIVNGPTLRETGGSDEIVLPFEHVVIRDGKVSFDVRPHVAGELHELELQLDVADGDLEIDLYCGGGFVEGPPGREAIESFAFGGGVYLSRGEEPTLVDASELLLQTTPVEIRLSEARIPIPFEQDWEGRVELRVDIEPALAWAAPLLPEGLPPLSGQVDLDVRAGDSGDGPSGEGRVSLLDAVVESKGIGERIDLQLAGDLHRLRILEGSEARVILDGGVARIQGHLDLDEGAGFPLEVRADVDDLELEKLLDQLGVGPDAIIHWPMSGRAELAGTLLPLELNGPVSVESPTFHVTENGPYHAAGSGRLFQTPRGRIRGRWRITEEALDFLDMSLDTARSHVDVPLVHIGFMNTFRVDVRTQQLDLRDISPLAGIEVGGVVTQATLTVGPDFLAPRVEGTFRARDFLFGGFDMADVVESDFHLSDDYMTAHFPNLRAEKNTSRYRVDDLAIDFQGGMEVNGHLRASRLTLADLYDVFGFEGDERYEPYQSVMRGHATLHYSLGHEGDGPNGTLETELDFDMLESELAGYAFGPGKLQANWRWLDWERGVESGVLTVHHFGLSKGDGSVAISGRMGLGTQLALTVAADQLAIRETEGFEDLPALHGTFAILGDIRGTMAVPRMHLDLAMTGLRWGDTMLGDARAYVRLTDRSDPWVAATNGWNEVPEDAPCGHARHGFATGRWAPGPPIMTVDGPEPARETPQAFLLCGEGLDGQVRVDLAFGWTDVFPMRGVIDVRDMVLDPYLGDLGENVGGSLSGRIALDRGALLEQHRLGGRLRIDALEVAAFEGGTPVAARNDGPIVARIRNGGLEVERAVLRGSGSRLRLGGTASHRGDLALQVDGRLDLGVLSSLSDSVEESAGRLRLRVNVNGNVDDPTVFGSGEISSGRLVVAALPAPLESLEGELSFSERRVLIQRFEGELAGGTLAATGAAEARDGSLESYDIEIDLRDVNLRDEDMALSFDSDLRAQWSQGDRLPLLTGELRMDRARYRKDVHLSPQLGQLYRPQRAEVERYDPEADNVRLDLRLVTRAPLRVDNNIFRNVDVMVDDGDRPFRIVGTDQRYGVVGNLVIPRGGVRFRNTNLDIQRGEVRFDDESRVDPHFDILTETEIRRQQSQQDASIPAWRVQVRAHGTMDGFRLDATSQPQLSQDDIMLLLTVGLTSNEAQQLLQEGDIGSTALEVLSAISGVNDEVTNAVGVIDEFALTTRYSPVDGRQEPVVTIGKRISDRVRLSAATGLTTTAGQQRTVQAGLEWQVGDQTSLQVIYDSLNRESASSFGNVGVDLHWRIEFE